MFYVQLALAGIAAGAVYSLAGMGVVLTYKATGVFNFAHGAIAVFVAYVFWQMADPWSWPVGLAAVVALLVVAPLIGYAMERLVFRPLQASGASTSERLVATLGLLVLGLGGVIVIWTGEVRQVPSIVPQRPLTLIDPHIGADGIRRGGLIIGSDQVFVIGVVVVVSVAIWALFRFTHLGTEIRAVVDRRELAELAGINANRVAALSWMLGATFSALTGVLFVAGSNLDPFRLALFVIETFSIAVVARLTSLPIAMAAGILLLGIGDAFFEELTINGGQGFIGETFNSLKPNLSTVVLFAALLIYRRLDVVGEEGASTARQTTGAPLSPALAHGVTGVIVAAFLVMPLFLDRVSFDSAQRMLAMAVIFTSIVAITGFSGNITLGQAGIAGLGAFASTRIANSWGVPVVFAMIFGGVVAMAVGFLAGYPALRRRGLFLGLTTLALGLMLSRFVLESPQFAGGTTGLRVERPNIFGVALDSDTAFYYFELVWVGLTLLLARNLKNGRMGRALAAMRDSEAGASSVGIDLRRYKLFIFAASSFMAGIGGALLTQTALQYAPTQQFFPLNSLFWFAAVVVAGISSLYGAVLAAVVFVMLDLVFAEAGASQFVIGFAALSLGRIPGGNLVGVARTLHDRVRLRVDQEYEEITAARRSESLPPPYRPSPEALAAMRRAGARR